MIQHLMTLLLLALPAFGEKRPCFCDNAPSMNGATVSCDTTIFKNNAKLYWQYNCDRIWLTLENTNGQKRVIDEVPVELYGYAYRLGFQWIKEFENSLLFRSGCPANGPCTYTLLDKDNGQKRSTFDQLICIDTDSRGKGAHSYDFDFIVYFSDDADHLIIDYIDSPKKLNVPFEDQLSSSVPQHQFDEMTLENNILTLIYQLDNNEEKTLKIDLNDPKYSR